MRLRFCVEEMTEKKLSELIRQVPYFSWTFFIIGSILMVAPPLFAYFYPPYNPITFTLPQENFLPYAEAVYIVKVFVQFGGIITALFAGCLCWLASHSLDMFTMKIKTEQRLRKIEQKIKEQKL
jgi:formate hydrogenlyase subunit 3/multisubunit Na+/H+ antiporter MnhD subunit